MFSFVTGSTLEVDPPPITPPTLLVTPGYILAGPWRIGLATPYAAESVGRATLLSSCWPCPVALAMFLSY